MLNVEFLYFDFGLKTRSEFVKTSYLQFGNDFRSTKLVVKMILFIIDNIIIV